MHSGSKGSTPGNEKPKDFGSAIIRLAKSLKNFKVLIILAIVLASLSAVLSLVAPNRISSLTDEISKGLVINTDNMEKLQKDLMTNVTEDKLPVIMNDLLDIKFGPDTMGKIMASGISIDDKNKFTEVMSNMSNDRENSYKYIRKLTYHRIHLIRSSILIHLRHCIYKSYLIFSGNLNIINSTIRK